jgi:hydrogenase maturation protein HypF
LFPQAPLALARQVAGSGVNAPASSSAGRLFDAVAACLGICPMGQSYEGEAAMRLEALADLADQPIGAAGYAMSIEGAEIDPAPMIRALAEDFDMGIAPGTIAAHFHAGLAEAFAKAARAAADQAGTQVIALSGGCFQNARLLREMTLRLDGYQLCLPREVPANDGGLAFGQALVALAQLESR